jgi:hypothetical protein
MDASVAFQGPSETDKTGVSAFFRLAAVRNPERSKEAGSDVFDNVEQVVMMLPKDNKTRPVFEARDEYKNRFPQAWKLFQDRVENAATGTPLTALGLSPADLATLNAARVMNVEQLAALNPASGDKRFGPRLPHFVKAANDYLKGGDVGGKVSDLEKENEALKERLLALENAALDGQESKPKARKAA